MRAAVFDFDGTLADSTEFWDKLAKTYLESQGLSPREDLKEAMESLTVEEGLAYMQTEYSLDKSLVEIRKEIDELLISYYRDRAELKPFAREFIGLLRVKNTRLVIASVTDEEFISILLKKYGIYDDFEFIETCGRLGLNKDNKKFFEKISQRLDTDPNDIFFFEDSLYSMRVAKEVGFKIVAVEDQYAKKDLEEILKVADIYVKNFTSLMEFLKHIVK